MIRLTRNQLREIDRRSIEDFNIPGVVLMENASRAVADVAEEMLKRIDGSHILILCGGGNNGGDGLAAARHLHNRGALIRLRFTADPGQYKGDALINWRIVSAMKLDATSADLNEFETVACDLIIDSVFGTGLSKPPRAPFDQIVAAVENRAVPVLAVDIPSGLDCDTGEPLGPTIRATRTVTFVAEKTGFTNPAVRHYLGQVTVADIGCPRELIDLVRQRGQ